MLSRLNSLAWIAGAALFFSVSLGAQAAGDSAAGEKKFYTCYGCHGVVNYKNAYPDYSVPKLRHQNAAYLIAALQEHWRVYSESYSNVGWNKTGPGVH